MEPKIDISIIIPAYNEETRISDTLKKVDSFMYANKHFSSYEIIVVDDGSTDNTAGLVTDLSSTLRNLRLIRNNANKGKGYTVKNGVLHSKYAKILFCDADLSTPIQELNNLIKFIGNYDIVVGTRTDKKRLKQNNHSLEYFLAKHTQN